MKKNILFTVISLLILSAAFASGQESGVKKPVGIDFFTKVKSISNLKEKDGNIFFVISQPDREENTYTRNLYQLIDGRAVRISQNVSDYFFEEGGTGIIFRSIREEKDRERVRKGEELTVFQKLAPGYGEATEWLRLPFSAGQIQWIDKDRFFYTAPYSQHFQQFLNESGGNRQDALKKRDENRNYRIFDELPFWSNGRGDVSGQRSHLYFYNNGERTLLNDTLESVSQAELSPDRKTLIFVKQDARYGKAPNTGNKLFVLDVATLTKKELPLFDKVSYGGFYFIDNDEVVLTVNHSIERDKNLNSGIYRLNLKTGKATEIYDGSYYSPGGIGTDIGSGGRSGFRHDKDGLFYVSTIIDQAHLIHQAFRDAKVNILTKGQIAVSEFLPYKDGFLIAALVEQRGSEVYFLDKKGVLTQLTSINKPLFDEHKIVSPLEITFTNGEGRKLNGYVLPPAYYEKGKKYPAILDIHGGPKSTYGTVFFHEMQYWANQGYAVLFTNPTGSSGRGNDFADIRGKIGTVDYNDLMNFVDAAIEQSGFIDENRLGVTGGSYGGVMTNWIIGHTDRFKAAASQRSASSWLTFSNTSDIGYTFTYTYFGTDLWKNHDLLWDRSPLKYADRVKTPTLFLHSEEDYRCWLVEGLQMYYALQYFEVPSRIVIFKGENHELSRSGKPVNRIKRLDEITKWFDNYLKK
ncbi:MAG: S9 family peptidase [Tannerella sp.]|jgi:dipeptidyl aminopeptidase/acylaminoacyl peptidase|nr:S9 family peptidase [Tannerella sp.]